jgi:hypothetical protein
MVGGAETELDFQRLENVLPQRTCEDTVTVRNDAKRRAVKLHHTVQESLSYCLHCIWVRQWHEMSIFRESIHNDHDDVLAL